MAVREHSTLTTAQRHDVCDIFSVGPRFKLFDGMSGISQYLAPKRVYLNAIDGRLLQRSPGIDVSLVDPSLAQGGSARVCDCLRICNTSD